MKLKDFDIISKLGEGGFATAHLAKCKKDFNEIKLNHVVAMKVISKKHTDSIEREIEVRLKL